MRVRVHVLLAVVVCVALPGLRVDAQQAPTFSVDPGVVELGKSVHVDGFGFEPGTMRIYLDGTVGTSPIAEVEHTGQFNFLVEIAGVTEGKHEVIACNNQARTGVCRQEEATALVVTVAATTTTLRTTTTTTPPRATTTTTNTTTTTRPPSPTRTTTTVPPTATLAPTTIGAFAVSTTAAPPPTISGGLAASIPIGPEPTFDPNPNDVAIVTTTEGPAYQSPNVVGDYPDLSVVALEVSQGIQNLTSRMPLVADRTTWIRVYVDSTGTDSWAPVDGAMLLQRAGHPDVIIGPENGPIATKQPRTNINSTLNFEVPDEYLGVGELSLTVLVWSFGAETLDAIEPNPGNNSMQLSVEFHTADPPTIWLAALDDGAGPGPAVNDLVGLLGFAGVVLQDMLDYHPTAYVNFEVYPAVIEPGPEALVPGEWKLGWDVGEDPEDPDNDATDLPRRTEPNVRLAWLTSDLPEDANVLGMFDSSIPSDGYTGWAKHGVSWAKPDEGTPAHEIGHNRGLQHVPCEDADGDGIPDELKGGAVDPYHPTGLPPNCSLAPINPNGYYGLTTERDTLTVYSNDPSDPAAAFPLMGYKKPKWTDPYHWCILLDYVSVPCDSTTTGVPPKVLLPAVDCDPQPAGSGLGIDLCLIDQLPPPADPFGGNSGDHPDTVPFGGPVGYAAQPICDGGGSMFVQIKRVSGDSKLTSSPPCNMSAAGDGTTEHFFTVEIGEGELDLDTIIAPEEPSGWVLVSGYVNLDTGQAEIQQMATREMLPESLRQRYVGNVVGVLSGASPMSYAISVRNDDGVVSQIPVDLDGAGHGDGGERGAIVSFFQAVPADEHCPECWIEILSSTSTTQRPLSPEPPTVSSISVTDTADATMIEWAANDPDGDPLTFDVLWSADGDTWIPAATGIPERSLVVPHTARYPGGEDLRVQVVANDGTRSASMVSEPFAAPGHDPLMVISGVPESNSTEQYDTVLLQAHVVDPEDQGTRGASVTWRSDIDGDVASGSILRTRDLSPGVHTFTVDAQDSDGNAVTETFELDVAIRTTPTRYLETPDPFAVALLTGADTSPGSASDLGDGNGVAPGAVGVGSAAGEVANGAAAPSNGGGSGPSLALGLAAAALGGAAVGGVMLARRRQRTT